MERDPPDKQHSCKAEKTRRERPAKLGRVRPASSHQRALRDGLTEQVKGTIGRARAGGCQRSDSGRGVAAGFQVLSSRQRARVAGGDLRRTWLRHGEGWGRFFSAGESGGGVCPAVCTRGSQIPHNSWGRLNIVALTAERCLLLQPSGATGFIAQLSSLISRSKHMLNKNWNLNYYITTWLQTLGWWNAKTLPLTRDLEGTNKIQGSPLPIYWTALLQLRIMVTSSCNWTLQPQSHLHASVSSTKNDSILIKLRHFIHRWEARQIRHGGKKLSE